MINIAKNETLATLVAKSDKTIRLIFGLLSAVFFAGMLFLETYFATDFITASIQNIGEPVKQTWWIIFGTLLLFVVIYSSWGGIKKVFLTDRYQLGISYISFSIILTYLIVLGIEKNSFDSIVIWIISVVLFGILLHNNSKSKSSIELQILLIISFIIIFTIGLINIKSISIESYNIAGPFKQIREPGGIITLFGFMILNIFWQFCDSSNFQRLYAIRKKYSNDPKKMTEVIKRDFRPIVWVSPITWGLGILLGMGISASGIVPSEIGLEYQALIAHLATSIETMSNMPLFALLTLFSLGVGIASITLSTSDSSTLAFHQAISRDILDLKNINSFGITLISVLLFCLVSIICYLVKIKEYSSIYSVIAGFNAQILIFTPTILFILRKSYRKEITLLSLILGTIGVWWATFFPPQIFSGEGTYGGEFGYNVLLVLPIYVGLVLSFIPFVAFLKVK